MPGGDGGGTMPGDGDGGGTMPGDGDGGGTMPGDGDGGGTMPGDGDGGGTMPGDGDGGGMMPGDGDGDGSGMAEEPMLTVPEGLLASSNQPAYADAGMAGLLATLLPGGNTAFPALSTAYQREFGGNTTSVDVGTSVTSISSDGNGGFRVTFLVDDEKGVVHFPADSFEENPDGGGRYVVRTGDLTFRLGSYTGSFDEENRTSGPPDIAYFDILNFEHDEEDFDGPHRDIIFSFGVRTPTDGMPLGTAIYDGRVNMDVWNENDTRFATSRSKYRGNLTLEADFANSNISGTVDALSSRGPAEEGYSDMAAGNRVNISGGEIVSGQFVADWTGQGPEGAPLETVLGFEGHLLGEFYGPGAEEVAGILNGSREATGGNPAQVAAGYFLGGTGDDGFLDVTGPTASALAPVYAQDSDDTVANSANVVLGPQVIQRHRDWRNTKQRIQEGAPTRSAYVKSIAPDGSGGYHVTYVVDGSDAAIHFDQFMDQQSEKEIVNGDEFDVFVFGEGVDGDSSTAAKLLRHSLRCCEPG